MRLLVPIGLCRAQFTQINLSSIFFSTSSPLTGELPSLNWLTRSLSTMPMMKTTKANDDDDYACACSVSLVLNTQKNIVYSMLEMTALAGGKPYLNRDYNWHVQSHALICSDMLPGSSHVLTRPSHFVLQQSPE